MQFLILIALFMQSVSADVIDLGSLVIEGEIRKPMITKIVSKNHTDKMIDANAEVRLREIEAEILNEDEKNEK